jgi:hypothetical protein
VGFVVGWPEEFPVFGVRRIKREWIKDDLCPVLSIAVLNELRKRALSTADPRGRAYDVSDTQHRIV